MKGRRLYFVSWALLLAAWAGYFLAGARLAQALGAKIGDALLRAAQGKFNDPALFIQSRLREGLWLLTLGLVWVALHAVLGRFLHARYPQRRWHWAVQGLAGFVFLNAWVSCAMRTALFWSVLGAGAGLENYTQFQFKRLMAGEVVAPHRAVLVGNSQTRAQVNERKLNERLGRDLWTTELHFPGSRALDLVLIEPELEQARPDYVICYVTEGLFYSGFSNEVPKYFARFSDLPWLQRMGALSRVPKEELVSGLVGDAIPLFRCRLGLGQRLLGEQINHLRQQEYDANLNIDLEQRAAAMIDPFRLDAESELQQRAFREFISRCITAERRIILLVGGYHPALMRRLPPAIRAHMLSFLNDLQRNHPEVIVIPASDLPVQGAADYDDLTHANTAMQDRFTDVLAGLLRQKLPLRP